MTFGQNKGPAVALQLPGISFQYCFTRIGRAKRKMTCRDCQMCAYCKSHQVVRVRQSERFIEIIDAPDQPALLVAPGAKVLNVQIANRQHERSFGKVSAELGQEIELTS